MAINFSVQSSTVSFSAAASGGTAGSNDHKRLKNRDAENQHPIEAITGLADALASINGLPDVTVANNNQIMRVVDGKWELSAFYSVTSNDAGGNTLNL